MGSQKVEEGIVRVAKMMFLPINQGGSSVACQLCFWWKNQTIKYFIKLHYDIYIFPVLIFQQLTQENYMTPKYFHLEEYITTLYHLSYLKVNMEKIKESNCKGERIIWTLIECIYVEMIFMT